MSIQRYWNRRNGIALVIFLTCCILLVYATNNQGSFLNFSFRSSHLLDGPQAPFDPNWIQIVRATKLAEGKPINTLELAPRMSEAEVRMFRDYLSDAVNYFEFGCGGSTVLAASFDNIKTIHSVHSNLEWITNVATNRAVQSSSNKITFHFVDINADPENEGYPRDGSHRLAFPLYSSQIQPDIVAPLSFSRATQPKPDLVLVDGPFRVASVLRALLELPIPGHILIHDYSERTEYHVVEQFLDRTQVVDSLAAFRPKPIIERAKVRAVYEQYKLNPAA